MNPRVLFETFDSLYLPMRLVGCSPKSIHQHRVALGHFQRFLGREPTTDDLTDLSASSLLAYLAERQAAITANKTLDKLLAQWRFLSQQGLVSTWPNVRKLPEPEVIPLAWLDHEMRAILAACGKAYGRYSGVRAADWWLGLHLVIYDTAERISAVLGLEWSHYDPQTRWLHIPAELRKGKRRSRMVRLGPDTAAQLAKIAKPVRPAMFPWEWTVTMLYKRYDSILRDAGLPTDRRSKFHRLRRTVASYYKRAGGDARELLDHSSWSVTAKYLDPRLIGSSQASDLLPRIA